MLRVGRTKVDLEGLGIVIEREGNTWKITKHGAIVSLVDAQMFDVLRDALVQLLGVAGGPLVCLADVDPDGKPTIGERAAFISGAKRQHERVVDFMGPEWDGEHGPDLDPRFCEDFSHGPIAPRSAFTPDE
jgi:hypothetical protein